MQQRCLVSTTRSKVSLALPFGFVYFLMHRGYDETKIAENVEAEIMQVVLDEARDSYAEEIVVELNSETLEQMESNVGRCISWVKTVLAKRTKSDTSTSVSGATTSTSSSTSTTEQKQPSATTRSARSGMELDD